MEFYKLFRTVQEKTENSKSRPRRAKKALEWWIRDLENEEFKDILRMDRETFNFILCRIEQSITKEPMTVMVPNPIVPHRHLALTIYRMAHGCSFKVVKYIFGVSHSLATQTFNQVIRVLISSCMMILLNSQQRKRVGTRMYVIHRKLWIPLCRRLGRFLC